MASGKTALRHLEIADSSWEFLKFFIGKFIAKGGGLESDFVKHSSKMEICIGNFIEKGGLNPIS